MKSIFLSASIPKPGREFYGTANPLFIHSAIRAFLSLVLGRRHIVWGGHPSITPMVSAACDGFGLEYLKAVTLYQSRYFIKDFPTENDRFDNIILIEAKKNMEESLIRLRQSMFSSHEFDGAVFIGGMNGVIDEHAIFTSMYPKVPIVAVYRTGAAAAKLALQYGYDPETDFSPTDFTQLYIDRLNVTPSEPRSLP